MGGWSHGPRRYLRLPGDPLRGRLQHRPSHPSLSMFVSSVSLSRVCRLHGTDHCVENATCTSKLQVPLVNQGDASSADGAPPPAPRRFAVVLRHRRSRAAHAIIAAMGARTVIGTITSLPLLILVVNMMTNTPPPQRKLRVVTATKDPVILSVSPPPPPPVASPPPPPSATSPPPPGIASSLSSPPPAIASALSSCDNGSAHIELWGSLILAGPDNEQPTAMDCCRSCREYEPTLDVNSGAQCNTWVYNPTSRACWLKNQKPEELPKAAARLQKPGNPKVPWHSGVWMGIKACADCTLPSHFNGCIGKDRCNTSHECGSPASARTPALEPNRRHVHWSLVTRCAHASSRLAVDGYAHVDPKCFLNSPTARTFGKLLSAGTPLVAFADQAADYDGLGVRWGIGNKKATWQECESSCRDFQPAGGGGGPFKGLPCNVWTWCSRKVCFEPDAHSHSFGDCWLKFTETPESPEVNMRTPGMLSSFMRRHKKQMAEGCPWVSGALLPPGVNMTNGTWGPRAFW